MEIEDEVENHMGEEDIVSGGVLVIPVMASK